MAKSESPLIEAATEFDEALTLYGRLGDLFLKTPLTSLKHLERANQTLGELADCEQRLQDTGKKLIEALTAARQTQERLSQEVIAQAPEDVRHLESFARRVHQLVAWHTELYVDSTELAALFDTLVSLPAVSIDHLGLSKAGFPTLLKLVEKGVRVKATGFGRIDFDVRSALSDLYAANPHSLMFGTDLPSTRAPRPYLDSDYTLVLETLGEEKAANVFYNNAIEFYRPKKVGR